MAFSIEQRQTLAQDFKTINRVSSIMKTVAVDVLGETSFTDFQQQQRRRAYASRVLAEAFGGQSAKSMTNILAAKWEDVDGQFGTGAFVQPAWGANQVYSTGDRRAFGAFVYEANKDHGPSESFNSADWDVMTMDVVRGISDDELKAGVEAFWGVLSDS